MEVGALLLPPAMVAEALTPAAVALLRESPVQLSIEARTEPAAAPGFRPEARASLCVTVEARVERRHRLQAWSAPTSRARCARWWRRARRWARAAARTARCGASAPWSASPWSWPCTCAGPRRPPWRLRAVSCDRQPRACCAAAQVRNRADAGCSVEASLACHAASAPPGAEQPLLDTDVLASGVLSGASRAAGRARCVRGPLA